MRFITKFGDWDLGNYLDDVLSAKEWHPFDLDSSHLFDCKLNGFAVY